MVFEHHIQKLEEIQKNLNKADYAEAKNNVAKHLKNELQGNAVLSDLRGYVNEYEKLLRAALSDIDALSYETTENRLLRREECKANIELARQKLVRIKEIMPAVIQFFKE